VLTLFAVKIDKTLLGRSQKAPRRQRTAQCAPRSRSSQPLHLIRGRARTLETGSVLIDRKHHRDDNRGERGAAGEQYKQRLCLPASV
jgi:hypothetical protein